MRESPSIAVERALKMLDLVAARPVGLSNSDLSRRLGIPKSSASYILRALEHNGYVRRDENNRYHLGLKVLSLRHTALSELEIREIAQPILRQLVDKTQQTAHLAILDHGEAVYVDKVDAPGFIKMDTWIGRRMDLHSTSVGKALLAYLPEEEIHQVLGSRSLKRRTPHTITAAPKLLRELERVREQGFAVDDEENNPGVRCVAAPVFNAAGGVEASIGLTGTTSQVERSAVPRVAETVIEAARRISQQLGYHQRHRASNTHR